MANIGLMTFDQQRECFAHMLCMEAREPVETSHDILSGGITVLFVHSKVGCNVTVNVVYEALGDLDKTRELAKDTVALRDSYIMDMGRKAIRDRANYENKNYLHLDEADR